MMPSRPKSELNFGINFQVTFDEIREGMTLLYRPTFHSHFPTLVAPVLKLFNPCRSCFVTFQPLSLLFCNFSTLVAAVL